ncbi:hypothetical protein OD783_21995, partial [Pseudomonas aeruginosa]
MNGRRPSAASLAAPAALLGDIRALIEGGGGGGAGARGGGGGGGGGGGAGGGPPPPAGFRHVLCRCDTKGRII